MGNTTAVQLTGADEITNEHRMKFIDALIKAAVRLEQEGRKVTNDPHDIQRTAGFKHFMEEMLKSPFGAAIVENNSMSPNDRDSDHFRNLSRGIGKAFVEDKDIRAFLKHPNGNSKTLDLGSFFGGRRTLGKAQALRIARKTAGLSGTSGLQQVLAQDLIQDIYELPVRPLRIRDAMPVFTTKKDIITFAQQTGFVNNAALTPINTDPATATSLPQSQIATQAVSATVVNIGHYIPVPTQILDDVEEVEGLLEEQMEAGVLDKEDAQALNGTGPANNQMQGLQSHPLNQQNLWSAGDPGDNQADCILNAIAKAWVAYYQPDFNIMNPINVVQIIKLKDDLGRYLFPMLGESTAMDDITKSFVLWGMPIVQTIGQTLNTILTKPFRKTSAMWDRQEASVYLAKEHLDWATKNLVAAICQERVTITDFRPESGVVSSLDNAPV